MTTPTREQQCTYLFKTCTDLYQKGLVNSQGVGPERAAAFAAGYVDGMTSLLRNLMELGAFDQDLQEAYAIGLHRANDRFTPPKWHLAAGYTEAEPLEGVEEEGEVLS